VLLTLLMLSSLALATAENDCPQIDKDYILGNYKGCASALEGNSSMRCRYLKAVCEMADSSYDKSRYDLSLISADVKDGKFSDLNALALTSLAEIASLQGDYKRARTLSSAISDVLIKKLPASYPYSVSEVLLTKSYFDARDIREANKKLEAMKNSKVDSMLFSSLDPWQ
jgi:hypothetical protein